MHSKSGRLARVVATTSLSVVVVTSCSSDQSIMNPQTDEAERIAGLGWLMLAIAGAVFVLVMGLLAVGLLRRRPRTDATHAAPRDHRRWIVLGGIALPAIVVTTLSGLTVWALAEEPGEPDVQLTIVGHQYWWEVRYADSPAVTANELHIPVGENVEVTVEAADVIHSLWVPQLGPKRDLVPGRSTTITWRANEQGTYRGQCAEYCGLQHANMALTVVAEPRDDFDAWLRNEAADARRPSSAAARAGLVAFVQQPCGACHTIRGTDASGDVGPDLTHLASRTQIGAGVAPLDRGHLGGWIADSQSLKPGNLMPPVAVSPSELQSLLVYLESLE